MSTTTVSTCSGTFYDSSGSTGNYPSYQDIIMTFTSDSENFLLSEINISIYLNPTTGIFTIEGKNIQSIEITNICGQLVETQNFVSLQNKTIDLRGQPKGVYFVKIYSNKRTKNIKIVLQ